MTRACAALVFAAGWALLASGCGSPEPAPAPRRRVAKPKPKPVAAASPSPSSSEQLPAGQVRFSIQDADLASDVLPLFERQAGVRIRYQGDPRLVTLTLHQPVGWEVAMDLVCRFTRTHLTKDYQGRLVLKDGYGGDAGDGDMDALLKERGGSATVGGRQASGNSGGGRSSGSSGASGGASTGSSGGSFPNQGDAYSGGKEARGLLDGVTTTNSGPR